MAILSSSNVLFVRIVFLFTLAFYCLKDASMLLESSFLLVLTQSMNLPALVLSPYSAQLGVFSYLFALVAITDLIPLLERNYMFFESIVPFRLMIFFLVTATSFVMKDNLYLHNNVVFVYGFVEIWLNFLAFSALREEKNERFANEKRIIAADYLSEETNDTEEVSTGLEGEYEEEFEQLETIAEEEEEL